VNAPSDKEKDSGAKPGGSTHWIAHVVVAVIGGIALTGMLIGFGDTITPAGQPSDTAAGSADMVIGDPVPQAVVYSEMTGARFGPNAGWQAPWPSGAPDVSENFDATAGSDQQREAATDKRAQRRAYSGAPPVVPHAIDQTNVESCLVCHGQGLKVGQVTAPKMSHEVYGNCTQCHVESINRALPPTSGPRAAATLFQGLSAPGPGERVWPGAPPTIPHTTWMRENCNSCHGMLADKGLQTSHPWRGSCTQCHAPSAELDQWQALSADRPPVVIREDLGQ